MLNCVDIGLKFFGSDLEALDPRIWSRYLIIQNRNLGSQGFRWCSPAVAGTPCRCLRGESQFYSEHTRDKLHSCRSLVGPETLLQGPPLAEASREFPEVPLC